MNYSVLCFLLKNKLYSGLYGPSCPVYFGFVLARALGLKVGTSSIEALCSYSVVSTQYILHGAMDLLSLAQRQSAQAVNAFNYV